MSMKNEWFQSPNSLYKVIIIVLVNFVYCVMLVCDIPASSNALQLSGIQLLRFSVLLLLKALQKLLENIKHKE